MRGGGGDDKNLETWKNITPPILYHTATISSLESLPHNIGTHAAPRMETKTTAVVA